MQKRIIYFQDEGSLTKKICEQGKVKHVSDLLVIFYLFLLTHYISLRFWDLHQFHSGSSLGSPIELRSSWSHIPFLMQSNSPFPKCDAFCRLFVWNSFVSRALCLVNPGLFHPFLNRSTTAGYCIPLENLYALAVQKFQGSCVLRSAEAFSISDKNRKEIHFESDNNWNDGPFLFKKVDLNRYIHL